MDDLNDIFYFCKVVEHQGFSSASRALGIPRSRLSRRVRQLENKYDVVLIQRSTRQFSVTDLGQEFYERGVAALIEADAARELILNRYSEPQGIVRISCTTTLLQYRIGSLLNGFMSEYPKVSIRLLATNRRVEVISEGLDIAFRVRFPPLEDSSLKLRTLTESHQRLVASPILLDQHDVINVPADLNALPSMDWFPPRHHVWSLIGPAGEKAKIAHEPRYLTDDLTALCQAAIAGVGIVQLPCMVVENELKTGKLVEVLPGWHPKVGIVHAVFPSRRGLLPSVRYLLDYVADNIIKPA